MQEASRSADVYHLELELIKESGEWLVRKAIVNTEA